METQNLAALSVNSQTPLNSMQVSEYSFLTTYQLIQGWGPRHRHCHKIYPKICLKIIRRQRL